MSVRIKISYTTDEELNRMIRLLSPEMKSYKVGKRQEGQYKRAYVMMANDGLENANKC